MKGKRTFYWALVFVGLCLISAALLLRNAEIANSAGGALMGSGSGLAAMGFAQLLTLRQAQKNPAQMRRNEIEYKDERNVAIRRRAKALSGDILQWTVMAAAWVSMGFDLPLWITLSLVMVFLMKSALDLWLIIRYQREM